MAGSQPSRAEPPQGVDTLAVKNHMVGSIIFTVGNLVLAFLTGITVFGVITWIIALSFAPQVNSRLVGENRTDAGDAARVAKVLLDHARRLRSGRGRRLRPDVRSLVLPILLLAPSAVREMYIMHSRERSATHWRFRLRRRWTNSSRGDPGPPALRAHRILWRYGAGALRDP